MNARIYGSAMLGAVLNLLQAGRTVGRGSVGSLSSGSFWKMNHTAQGSSEVMCRFAGFRWGSLDVAKVRSARLLGLALVEARRRASLLSAPSISGRSSFA